MYVFFNFVLPTGVINHNSVARVNSAPCKTDNETVPAAITTGRRWAPTPAPTRRK